MYRIYLVEDQPMIRRAEATVLNNETDLTVCGSADTAEQALNELGEVQPDLVVTDLSLPGKSGRDLIEYIKVVDPELPIVVFSLREEPDTIEQMLDAGASAYVVKSVGMKDLLAKIRDVLQKANTIP